MALGAFEGERADRPAVFCNSAIARRRAWRARASRSGVIPVGGGGDCGGGGVVADELVGGEGNRLTNTLNSFLSESSFRPPSGVPVMAK